MVPETFIVETSVNDAKNQTIDIIKQTRDRKIIYFYGWDGFGAAPVLRSVVQELLSVKTNKNDPKPELCYDEVIYIDCSEWISRRAMQRKIAEELQLDRETISMFDKQDEEDNFSGVEPSDRDVIPSVSLVIARILFDKKFMMVFLNGSDDEVDVSTFGITPRYLDHTILWTFKKRLLTIQEHDKHGIANKLRYTQLFIPFIYELSASEYTALLREEAAIMVARNPCMQDIDLNMVRDFCLYYLFMHYCFHGINRFYWAVQAPNCWLSDGNNNGGITKEITDALHAEINWDGSDVSLLEKVFEKLMRSPDSPFLVVKNDNAYTRRPYNWIAISVTSKKLKVWDDTQTLLATTTSFFVASEKSMGQQTLPNGLFDDCNNLQVLILSNCSFSFVSPPFLKCHKLRFLGLDHCTDNRIGNVKEVSTEWVFLQKLLVLDIRYTHWSEIITEEKMDHMANLQELNIEGFCCWQHISKLQGRLPNLQRLRIIKPIQEAQISIDCSNSFMDKTKLEILDLSDNRDLKNLPSSLSKASSLQMLILDGCDGLENVVASDGLPSSLRVFSFDGFGAATSSCTSTVELPLKSSRPQCTPDANNKETVKTKKVSLEGCTRLESLFLRGLPNLEELDLSGTAIEKLNFETMVVDVPRLKGLFLLGCELLRAIKWGSNVSEGLEVLCLDTRAVRGQSRFARQFLTHYDVRSKRHVHAILADARLVRSLEKISNGATYNIHITSSTKYDRAIIGPEAAQKEMIEPNIRCHHGHVAYHYDGVLIKISDVPMLVFPEPPTQQMDRHIEFSDVSLNLEAELADYSSLAQMLELAQSLHVHDVMIKIRMPRGYYYGLKWCRIERCSYLDRFFGDMPSLFELETIWVSNLLMARNIFSTKLGYYDALRNLQRIHLCSCPRLQFVLPVPYRGSLPNLETIHIIHCGDLKHVFVACEGMDPKCLDVWLPKLTTINLHDLPKLQQISENKMLAPALKTIKIRGCFGLRRLPAVAAREPGQRRPIVEIEKDVWDALEWDGKVKKHRLGSSLVDIGHHPDFFEPPVHSRHFKKRHLKGTVLR